MQFVYIIGVLLLMLGRKRTINVFTITSMTKALQELGLNATSEQINIAVQKANHYLSLGYTKQDAIDSIILELNIQ